jgi:DNA-binding NtrC family response regulator
LSIVILCVDDDHTALTVRRLLLSTKRYTALTAPSTQAAMRLLNCNHIDLVITDHSLADDTGAQLMSQMKRLQPEVPVVLLTAGANVPPEHDLADRLLSKCMTAEEFLTETASLLSHLNKNTRHSDVSNPSLLVA